jgi:release factor glutamine methyltransferase
MDRALLLATLAKGKRILERANVSSPQTEAETLMTRLTGYKRHELYLKEDLELKEGFDDAFMDMIKKRCEGIPIQYITGVESFMGMDFKVNGHTLIPRADTEVLVESVLRYAKSSQKSLKLLDLCTGSGNIAVSLAKFLPRAKITAIDISFNALEAALENARLNEVEDKIEFLAGDMFYPLKNDSVFDIIVSNPPYIKSADISGLEPQVRLHEPEIALDGGMDGLNFYRELISRSYLFLRSGGLFAVEVGHDQALSVIEMIRGNGNYKDIEAVKDIAMIDRVVLARAK